MYHLGDPVRVCNDHNCWRHCCLALCSLYKMHQMQQCHCSDAAAMIEEVDGDLPPPKSTTDMIVGSLKMPLEFAASHAVVARYHHAAPCLVLAARE